MNTGEGHNRQTYEHTYGRWSAVKEAKEYNEGECCGICVRVVADYISGAACMVVPRLLIERCNITLKLELQNDLGLRTAPPHRPDRLGIIYSRYIVQIAAGRGDLSRTVNPDLTFPPIQQC